MAKIFVLSVAYPPQFDDWARGAATVLKDSAAIDRVGKHQLTSDPDVADIILFAEMNEVAMHPFMHNVLQHPLYKRYPEKCFLYWPGDYPITLLPGIYCSIETRWHNPTRSRGGPYLTISPNPYVNFRPLDESAPHLFSFKGAIENHPVRGALIKTLGAYPHGVFVDVSKESTRITSSGNSQERDDFWRGYADMMQQTKFVLCPRGIGASSIRLFESMKMGRVPVIFSDAWVAPEGPDWDSFALRIKEKDVPDVIRLLEEKESIAGQMGQIARKEWETFFGPDVLFDYIVDQCISIEKSRTIPQYISRWLHEGERFRLIHLRRQWWELKRKLKR